MDGGGVGKGGLGGPSWDIWELGNWGAAPAAASSSADAPAYTAPPAGYAVASSSAYNSTACSPFPDRPVVPAGGGDHYPFFSHGHQQHHQQQQLTCLKLGKRPYYEAEGPGAGAPVARRPAVGSSSTSGVVPRCQVEGCGKPLGDAKEYHRRHKVCDPHSKAPRVIVLGAEQRFCQQCSRFHMISEFDDSKRSCRRRLAGHNERRRKSTNDSILRNNSLENTMISSKFPFITSTSPGRALSLLSSKSSPWVSTSDLSSRSSAALRELIAENRAALLAHQLFSDRSCYGTGPMAQAVFPCVTHQNATVSQAPTQLTGEWNQTQVTLDLMQMPNTSLEILPGRSKTGNDDEHCCDIWKSLEGAHMV